MMYTASGAARIHLAYKFFVTFDLDVPASINIEPPYERCFFLGIL